MTDLTTRYIQLVIMQGQVLNTMAMFKKPAEIQFLLKPLQEAFESGEAMKKDRKSPINHVNVITDSFQLLQYPVFEEAKVLVDNTNEFLDMIPFNGNKIMQKGVEKDVEWYKCIFGLSTTIRDFIKENFDKVNKWTGSDDGAQAYFEGATTPDKLNDFSSLESGGPVAAGPAGSSSSSSAPAGSAGDAIGDEFNAATSAQLAALKTAAGKIENQTVKDAVDRHV